MDYNFFFLSRSFDWFFSPLELPTCLHIVRLVFQHSNWSSRAWEPFQHLCSLRSCPSPVSAQETFLRDDSHGGLHLFCVEMTVSHCLELVPTLQKPPSQFSLAYWWDFFVAKGLRDKVQFSYFFTCQLHSTWDGLFLVSFFCSFGKTHTPFSSWVLILLCLGNKTFANKSSKLKNSCLFCQLYFWYVFCGFLKEILFESVTFLSLKMDFFQKSKSKANIFSPPKKIIKRKKININ